MADETAGGQAPPRRRFEPLLRLMRWAYESPWLFLMNVAGAALIYTLLAWAFQLNAVTFDGTLADGMPPVRAAAQGVATPIVAKEVGYWSAPNWAFYSVFVMPAMITLTIRLWFITPDTLARLASARMARDEAGKPLTAENLQQRWGRVRGQALSLFLLIFTASMITVCIDWWTVVGAPLFDVHALDGVALNDPTLEFDWSIACRYPGVTAGCLAVGLYGGFAYLVIAGLVTSAVFASLICAFWFVIFLVGGAVDSRRRFLLHAVPEDPDDKRGGFGVFADFFGTLFALAVTVVVGCVTMILQNSYLRDPSSASIARFVFGDGREILDHVERTGTAWSLLDPFLWTDWVLAPQTVAGGNFQAFVGVILFAMTALVSVVSALVLLRLAARRALRRSEQRSRDLARELGMSHDGLKKALTSVDFWPVGWMDANLLLGLVFLLALSLFSYRLLVIPLILGLLKVADWLLFRDMRRSIGKVKRWAGRKLRGRPERPQWQEEPGPADDPPPTP